ncbi:MAG: hypothetical protein DHS20C18_21310 [Saprospiraceae bacterium]|nr:MAG: hypothetical protein DHS20C18_21310 [Saprospiraceae bacterium]
MNMSKTFTLNFYVLFFFLGLTQTLQGQMVWPGDINNSGKVTGTDLLYWGVAYNAVGPQRPNASSTWQAQPMGTAWGQTLPNGLNYAYVDADGNGKISDADMTNGIEENFHQIHGFVAPDNFPGEGIWGINPLLSLNTPVDQVTPGTQIDFEVRLGTNALPVSNFYGIVFTINYSSQLIQGTPTFEKAPNWWISPAAGSARFMTHHNADEGTLEVAITRINQTNISGSGVIGTFSVTIANINASNLPAQLEVILDDMMVVDNQMNVTRLAAGNIRVGISGSLTTTDCPTFVDPVCTPNGVTYLNSCWAEADGQSVYTSGTCFGDCIDPWAIDAVPDCDDNYEPVCGCNGVTYINECYAEEAGLLSFTPGPCNGNSNCYEPTLVLTSAGTELNEDNGEISIICPTNYQPVCGCNDVTYNNACEAEASGISFYTQGICNNNCVDASEMDPDAVCPTVYDPVCGCNGVTYSNECFADAAGVLSYTSGPCGGTSPWCAEAIPIQCGDFLNFETSIGFGNQITNYPGCSPYAFLGPEKVYVLNKTTAGDLQIGLEIITPSLDLDLFLLTGDCNQVTCLRSSTTNNLITNNEGIILEDAPIGIYYIVVDGQFPIAAGAYRMEVNCGYLDCSDAQALTCGQTYQGNNINGNDDVSLYGCGNVLNVENNGPEVVHTFTVTSAGPVDIYLNNLSANLELFLLRSCDRGDCIDYSQNSGNGNEHINAYLSPGTYYVVVDGYNGATSNYNLLVNCTSYCNFGLEDADVTSADCGHSNGSITVSSWGGNPGFLVYYSGPVSGSFYTQSNTSTIHNLPAGTYTVTKVDANGCVDTITVLVPGNGGLEVYLSDSNASCGSGGSIAVNILNGQAPYTVYVSGTVNTTLTSYTSSFNIPNLPAGPYTIQVIDAYGCSSYHTITIDQSGGSFNFNGTPYGGDCGELGYIHIETWGGGGPFNIHVAGPVSGSATSNSPSFNIINLPGGTYTVTVEAGNGCAHSEIIIVPGGGSLDVSATTNPGSCTQPGSITINIDGGSPAYTVSWSGPVNGSQVTNNATYVINNLPSGYYSITVEDGSGCSDYQVVSLENESGSLALYVIPLPGDCGQYGALWLDIVHGAGPYHLTWSGPVSGSTTTYNLGLDIPNLPCGTYTLTLTDNNNCTTIQTVILPCGGDLDVDVSATPGDCGQPGSISVHVSGGEPNYLISWSGPSSGSVLVNSSNYVIPNLPSGNYTINVTDANGCTDSDAITLNNAEGGSLSLEAEPLSGNCNQLGGIWLDIIGGSAPYYVSWTGPQNGSQTTNNNGLAIQNLPAGNYVVSVTDYHDCSGSVTVYVSVEESDLYISSDAVNGVCGQNGSIWIDIYGSTGPYTITWTGPSSGSVTINEDYYNIPNLPGGDYSITVTDGVGCSVSRTHNIYIYESDLYISADVVNGVCGQYGSIWIDIYQSEGPYTISWIGPVSGSVTINVDYYSIQNLPGGSYSITVTDGDGCSVTQTRSVYIYESDLYISTDASNGECGQNGSIWVDIYDSEGPYTISWSGPVSGSVTITEDYYSIPNLPGGDYIVTVTDDNGCSVSNSLNIYIYESDLYISADVVNGECGQNGAIWIDIYQSEGPYTISWVGPVSNSVTITEDYYSIPNLPAGTYSITVTDGNGCSVGQTRTVFIYESDLYISTDASNGICGQNGSIWVDIYDSEGPYTISWSGPVSGSVTITEDYYNIPDLPGGDYTVTVTDGNGCSVSDTLNIYIYDGDVEIHASLIYNECGQYNTIWVDIIGGEGPYIIMWTGPESGTETPPGNSLEIMDLPPGTYTIKVTDVNGCMDTVEITVYPAPMEMLHLTVVNGLCGENGAIEVTITGGTPDYQIGWAGPSSGSTTISDTSYTISDLPAGNYTVTLQDANGCTDVEVAVLTNAENSVDIYTTGTNGICDENGSIDVEISGGSPSYTINWSGPESGSTTVNTSEYEIPDLPSGTYTITVEDANGCVDSSTEIITVAENNIEVVGVATIGDCGEDGFIHISIVGGQPDYTISWSGPTSGSTTISGIGYDIQNLMPGDYTIEVTDANGCSTPASVTLNSPEGSLDVDLTAYNGPCGGLGNIWLDFNNGTATYTITWTGPVNGSHTTNENFYDILNLPTGTYTITITDINGCIFTEIVTITTISDNLSATLTASNGGCGVPGSIIINMVGGTAPYNISWSSSNSSGTQYTSTNVYTLYNLPTGIYEVTITDVNDCEEILSIQILNSSTTLAVHPTVVHPTCSQSGAIGLVINGGTPYFHISWSGPQSGSVDVDDNNYVIANLSGGTYTVTATDDNGCSWTQSIYLDSSTDTPMVDFNYSATNLSVSFTNLLAVGTYYWNFGDDNTSTDQDPIHTYETPGTYQVCLTVTNVCGTETHCEDVTVTMPGSIVMLDVGEAAGASGSTVQVPVYIYNCNLMVSLAGSLELENSTIATIVGVNPGMITPQYNAANSTFNFYSNTGQGVNLQTGDILFYLSVQLAGNGGAESDIMLSDSPLTIEVGGMNGNVPTVLPHTTLGGHVSIATTGAIIGTVETWQGEALANTNIHIEGNNTNLAEVTNTFGTYTMPNLPLGEMYTISADRNMAPSNGLSTYALFIGQRFILGMEPAQIYSPYQIIAGDANCNNGFTTLDLFIIQQLIIGATDNFAQCPSWVFVEGGNTMPDVFDAYNVFPYSNQSTMMVMHDTSVNFIGVKVGDILGDASPDPFADEEVDDRNDEELNWHTSNQQIAAGEYFDIPVTSSNFDAVVSYQSGISFPTDRMSFAEFLPGESAGLSNVVVGTSNVDEGELRLSWFNIDGNEYTASTNEVLFTLRFRAETDIDDLNGLFTVSDRFIRPEAHNQLGEARDIVIEITELSTDTETEEAMGYRLYQNRPNPFNHTTTIRFDLPQSMDIVLTIHDNLGRVIKEIKGGFITGKNEVTLEDLHLEGGVYYYTLKAGNFADTKSMVILK